MNIVDDRYWKIVAELLHRLSANSTQIVAPALFEQFGLKVVPYSGIGTSTSPDVVVVHKGMMDELGGDYLSDVASTLTPTFANEVFVVFTRGVKSRPFVSNHMEAFTAKLADLVCKASRAPDRVADLRSAIYLGDHIAITRTIYGHKMYVDTRDWSLAPHVLLDGFWEQWITNVYRDCVKPGMHVLDIGANIGWYSVLGADLVGAQGSLVAFEANQTSQK